MSASANDKFMKAGAGTVTTLSAPGKALSATSITVGSTTNYPTDTGIVFAIRQVDVNGELVTGTYTEWAGTVTSGTTLSMDAAPVYGSDQVYPAGSTTQVYIPLSSSAHNKMVDGLLVSHDQDGTLKAGAVDNAGVLAADVVETAKIKDANVTTAKINDGAVTAGKVANNASWRVISITNVTSPSTKVQWGNRNTVKITLDRIGTNATHLVYGYLIDGSGSHAAFDGAVVRSRYGLNGSGTMTTEYVNPANAQISITSMTSFQGVSGTLTYTGSDGANHMLLGTVGVDNGSIQTVHGSFWVSGGAVRGIQIECSAGTTGSGRIIIEALEN